MVEKVEAGKKERFLDGDDLQVLVTAKAEDSGMANQCMCQSMPCNTPCNMGYAPKEEKLQYE